jgi:hypothetical protein
MSNLRLYGGRVPVETGDAVHPVRLVEFPTFEQFRRLYGKTVKAESLDRYYQLLCARANGATLDAAAKPLQITKERARQIESKFLRLMRQFCEKSKRA